MSEKETDVTRRSTLKGLATGVALGLGTAAASTTGAASGCQYVHWCGETCWEGGVKVIKYECCDGDEMFEDCTVVSEYCGMCQ